MFVFIIIYCFPYAVPFDEKSMNYSCLIVGGLSVFVAGWWFWIRNKGYEGPRKMIEEVERRLSVGEEGVVAGAGRISVEKT